jgi:LPXTG-motif cell wall-anchored protein
MADAKTAETKTAETESKPVDEDALVADIDRTRAQLARTIDAISDRVSPKKNAERVMNQVRARASQIDPVMAAAAAGAVVIGVTALLLLRRRKR